MEGRSPTGSFLEKTLKKDAIKEISYNKWKYIENIYFSKKPALKWPL